MSQTPQKPVKMSTKELVAHFEAFLASLDTKGEETRGTYRRALREFVRWFPRDRRFRFTRRDVERYRRHLAETKELSNVSIGTYMTALRRFCTHLVEAGIIESNPAASVIGGRRPDRHSRDFLTEPEVRLLLDSLDSSTIAGLRDRAIIHLMLFCGISEHEAVNAEIGDLREAATGERRLYVLGKGKKAKDLYVTLPDEASRALDEYLDRRYIDASDRLATDPLFPSLSNRSHGRPMTTRGMRQAVNGWLRASGIKGDRDRRLTPFSLRHTAGVMLVDQGATVEEVMEKMRIEWRPTAQIYFRLRGSLGTVGPAGTRPEET